MKADLAVLAMRDEVDLRILGDLAIGLSGLADAKILEQQPVPPFGTAFEPNPTAQAQLEPGLGYLRAQSGNWTLAPGRFGLYVYGADLHIGQETIQTGKLRDDSTSIQAPLGDAKSIQYNRVYATLTGQDCRLNGLSGAGWTVHARNASLQLDGDFASEGVDASSTINGTERQTQAGLFQVIGSMTATASFTQGGSSWNLQGTARFAQVDGITLFGSRITPAGILVATGLLSLAALLAYTLKAFVANRNEVIDPLASPTRKQIVELLNVQGVATARDVAQRLGVARPMARHHLGLLLRQDVLAVRHDAGKRHYMLNSGSMEFGVPTNAGPSPTASAVLSVADHPIRRTCMQVLRANGPLDYSGLILHWPGPAPSQSALVKHLARLVQAGAVGKTRNGRVVRYYAYVDLDAVRSEGRSRYQESIGDPARH
jgi:hypothetical protein